MIDLIRSGIRAMIMSVGAAHFYTSLLEVSDV